MSIPRSILSLLILMMAPGLSRSETVARIVQPPQSIVIRLNRTGTYSCSGIGTFIEWRVNNKSIDAELRNIGFDDSGPALTDGQTPNLRTRELIVEGNSETNGSEVVCFAFLLTPPTSTFATSNSVRVMVSTPLESVRNLTVLRLNVTTIHISWNPPFTMEGLPIYGYNLTITNIIRRDIRTYFTTLTEFIDSFNSNDNFTVAVFAVNAVGPGETVVIQISQFVSSRSQSIALSTSIDSAVTTTSVSSPLPSTLSPPSISPSLNSSLTGGATILGAIVGIVIIATIGLVVLSILFLYLRRRNKSHSNFEVGFNNQQISVPHLEVDTQSHSVTVSNQCYKDNTNDEQDGSYLEEAEDNRSDSSDENDTSQFLYYMPLGRTRAEQETCPKRQISAPVNFNSDFDYSKDIQVQEPLSYQEDPHYYVKKLPNRDQ